MQDEYCVTPRHNGVCSSNTHVSDKVWDVKLSQLNSKIVECE